MINDKNIIISAQFFEDRKQEINIGIMQSGAGFIQNIKSIGSPILQPVQ